MTEHFISSHHIERSLQPTGILFKETGTDEGYFSWRREAVSVTAMGIRLEIDSDS